MNTHIHTVIIDMRMHSIVDVPSFVDSCPEMEWLFLCASQIILSDNECYKEIFNPPCAPSQPVLDVLYEQLVCMYVCMYVCTHVYICMYVCMYACMYVCMYACIYVLCVYCLFGRLVLYIILSQYFSYTAPVGGKVDDIRCKTEAISKRASLSFRCHNSVAISHFRAVRTRFLVRVLV